MAARGEAPNVARLIEMGTAFGHGAMAGLPTVTLANHTSIITSRLPGHHGILNNAWFDRRRGEQVITNSSATWPTAMQHVPPGVESIHDAVHRSFPDVFSASVNEPCDIGADYSTFDFFRRGEVPPIPSSPEGLPHTTERFVRPSKDYSWSSIVDHMGTEQAVGILSGSYRDETYPLPRFMFVNFTLTDSAMHEGGPYSEMAAASVRDSDARLGEVLAAVERTGAFDDSAFFLVADHGMEENDPASAATGTSTCARLGSDSATRRTRSSTSARSEHGRAVDRRRRTGGRAQRDRARVVARQPPGDDGDHRGRVPRAGERVRGRRAGRTCSRTRTRRTSSTT